MNIDNGSSWAIMDRCLPPKIGTCSTTLLKTTLWAIRSLNAFGQEISVDRKLIKKRTGYSIRSIDDAIRTLEEQQAIIKTTAHSPAGSTRFRVNYEKLMDWLDDEDREDIDLLINRRSTRKSAMVATTKSATTSELKSATIATQVGNGCYQSRQPLLPKSATIAESLKEVSAVSAISAPPAEETDRWLRNVALVGGGGGEMDRESWELIGKRHAKLDQENRMACATVLISRGIQDAELGLAAMEKLSDRLKGKGADNPMGLFTSFLDADRDKTGPCNRTIERHRKSEQLRDRLRMNIKLNWSDAKKMNAYQGAKEILSRCIGAERTAIVMNAWRSRETLLDWDAMLDFIAVNLEQIIDMETCTTGRKSA